MKLGNNMRVKWPKITAEELSAFNRPVRNYIWTILILLSTILPPFTSISETLLYLMFADFGINSINRTIEKTRRNSPKVNKSNE